MQLDLPSCLNSEGSNFHIFLQVDFHLGTAHSWSVRIKFVRQHILEVLDYLLC